MFDARERKSRLSIMHLLLSSHPDGMIVEDIQSKICGSGATLSYDLETLKKEDLVRVSLEGAYVRYRANVEVLQELLAFLYAETR